MRLSQGPDEEYLVVSLWGLRSAKRPSMLGTLICENSAFTLRGAVCTACREDN